MPTRFKYIIVTLELHIVKNGVYRGRDHRFLKNIRQSLRTNQTSLVYFMKELYNQRNKGKKLVKMTNFY